MEAKRVLFFCSLLILGLISDATFIKRHVGGYQPIKDLKDPYVVEIAKFAVSEHDKTKSSNLVFVKLVSAEKHVVSGERYASSGERHAGSGERHSGSGERHEGSGERHQGSGRRHVFSGTIYKLHIDATIPNAHSDNGHVYRAIVHDKPLEKIRSLTSFKKVEEKN